MKEKKKCDACGNTRLHVKVIVQQYNEEEICRHHICVKCLADAEKAPEPEQLSLFKWATSESTG